MTAGKPVWTASSFLLYTGGLTVLGSAIAALGYLSSRYGDAAYAGWSVVVFLALNGLAYGFRLGGRWIAAGIFAFASVFAWGFFVGALWAWFGWLHSSTSFSSFSLARLSLELLVLAAALDARRRFDFPLITAIAVVVAWLFVIDLISSGGTWTAIVTVLVGLIYFLAGVASRSPSAFWLQLAAGALVGGSVLYWWHTSDWQWALVAVLAVVYVGLAHGTGRSSWAVLGAVGILAAAAHFAVVWTRGGFAPFADGGSSEPRFWVPSAVFAFAGFLLVALGLRGASRRADA
jgi:hypothetical protein